MSLQTHEVLDLRWLSDETFVLRTSRPAVKILAGQCFSVGLSALGINREYSMYSAENDEFLEFLIRRVPDGAVSTALSKVHVGSSVQIGGPYGSFCLPQENLNQGHTFIASGTGIAPFASFVKSFPELNYQLFHGVRKDSETYESKLYSPESYFPAISRSHLDSDGGQRVTDLLRAAELRISDYFYLCGNRSMIVDCVSILRDSGIPGGRIFMETFF